MVTAETAVVAPFVVSVLVTAVWVVSLGTTQTRSHTAALEAARIVARGDTEAQASRVARTMAPDGATVRVQHTAGRVTVTVKVNARVPWTKLSHVVAASATATMEDQP